MVPTHVHKADMENDVMKTGYVTTSPICGEKKTCTVCFNWCLSEQMINRLVLNGIIFSVLNNMKRYLIQFIALSESSPTFIKTDSSSFGDYLPF